jgi:hypothetical protein
VEGEYAFGAGATDRITRNDRVADTILCRWATVRCAEEREEGCYGTPACPDRRQPTAFNSYGPLQVERLARRRVGFKVVAKDQAAVSLS